MDCAAAQIVLATAGVKVASGLTSEEFTRIEQEFGFTFPPDLREFLSVGLPVSDRWVDWRDSGAQAIRERLSWPLDGIFFDIEYDAFWLDEWGQRPEHLKDALQTARRAVSNAPVLIPIFAHRYLPAVPCERGNPVFSVYQTDIIYYGADLLDYFQNEFKYYFGRPEHIINGAPRRIQFWSMLEELNG